MHLPQQGTIQTGNHFVLTLLIWGEGLSPGEGGVWGNVAATKHMRQLVTLMIQASEL